MVLLITLTSGIQNFDIRKVAKVQSFGEKSELKT